ncbi:MAG: urea ABC transporter permease subunit UrtB [Alphaproteobacteria bacterium]
MIAAPAAQAYIAERDAAFALLKAKSAKQRAAGVEALAATADPTAVSVLEAMLAGNLFVRKSDKMLIIASKADGGYTTIDPVTNAQLGAATSADIKKVRVNNKIRRVIRGALGGLNLSHPERSKRLEAAAGLQKSPDLALRPALVKAFANETDPDVRPALALALAVIDSRPEAPQADRIAAITLLGESDATEARAILGRLSSDAEADATVRAAATTALKAVDDRLFFFRILGSVFQGVSLGSVLLLAAIGLAITFGVMGVINMAHGEMVMIGAYVTFMVQELFRASAPEYFGLSLAVAVPAAFLTSGLLGVGLERSVIRWLYGRPLETLLATWGVSLILQQAVRTIFGPTNREVGNPEWMSGAIELAGGVLLTYNRIWIIVFALAVLCSVWALIRFTSLGLEMRAVTQNRRMANSMGIRSGRVDALTFGLGSGVAGMAGVALSQIDNVSPNLGQAYIIDSFMVVVFGGVGNLWGTLVGALSLGIVNKFLEPVSGAVLGKIIVLVAIILFIQKRPRGLFALKGRAVEN